VPQLSVAENICLPISSRNRIGFLDKQRIRNIAAAELERVAVDISPTMKVADLSAAQQQFVEIAKALISKPRVLILDEPTASMTVDETNNLLSLVKRLLDQNISVVYVSHHIPEIYEISNRITVLRDGESI